MVFAFQVFPFGQLASRALRRPRAVFSGINVFWRLPLEAQSSVVIAPVGNLSSGPLNRRKSSCAAGVATELARLQLGLERVVGHDDAKQALVLALIAQEHVYIEGPPGVAKTMLAELAASLSALRLFCYQMHRDTRLAELVGDSVVLREADENGGEVIRHAIRPGGILKAQVCVLDDISRAPGEALNVLLRLLNERMFGSDPIPLLTAIATANPALESYYVEPLDPANLDRFTFQVKAPGLLQQKRWEDARRVVEVGQRRMPRGSEASKSQGAIFEANELRSALLAAHDALWDVQVGTVGDLLLEVLQELQAQPEINERNSMLSDRTFLVKVIKVMRAQAVLQGRGICIPADLHCIRFLTTFRLPPEVHERVPEIVDEVIRRHGADSEPDAHGEDPNSPMQPPPIPAAGAGGEGPEAGAAAGGDSLAHAKNDVDPAQSEQADAADEQASNQCQANAEVPGWWDGEADGAPGGLPLTSGGSAQAGTRGSEQGDCTPPTRRKNQFSRPVSDQLPIQNLSSLLRVVEGSVERGAAQQCVDSGGAQRHMAPLRGLADFHDVDAYDLSLWTHGEVRWPRSHVRQRQRQGGQLVLCRDVSSSMQGWRAEWAALVSCQLVSLAKRHRMRMGYVEFSHSAERFTDDTGAFISRDYDFLMDTAQVTSCGGSTNYQLALRSAMSVWEGAQSKTGNRHILFLTDGWPTVGDRTVAAERQLARKMGVRVHTVYLGCPWTYPTALHYLSEQTRGSQFSVYADPASESVDGLEQIQVEQRDPRQWILDPADMMAGPTVASLPWDEVFKRRAEYAPMREEIWWRDAAQAAI